MLMVPRAFCDPLAQRERAAEFNEKRVRKSSSPISPRSTSPSTRSRNSSPNSRASSQEARSDPVRIPPRTRQDAPERTKHNRPPLPSASISDPPPLIRRKESVQGVLSSTSIPTRKKPRGRVSQRLPRCDYVADFSKLMMDEIRPWGKGDFPRSLSGANVGGLFSSVDELLEDGQMFVGSDGLDAGILSARSLSNESLTSLGTPDETAISDDASHLSSTTTSAPERKQRLFASSVDCSDDHPLSPPREPKYPVTSVPDFAVLPTRRELSGRSKKQTSSFKSSLTASLKAIKSAARSAVQSSGVYATDCGQSEALLARSFFDIQPSLTDDRRPPPSPTTPSAELRRYLNPLPLEAAQLHFWQDHRHFPSNTQVSPVEEDSKNAGRRKRGPKARKSAPTSSSGHLATTKAFPNNVPLASCLPPSVRTAHASSPPIWLAPDGTPRNRNTAMPLLFDPDSPDGPFTPADRSAGTRIREPRENRDFLRVFVCEMQMRKHGKLKEDMKLGKARLWLPPVVDVLEATGEGRAGKKKVGAERWTALTPEDL